ncbi:hypothetical protein [Sphingomonas sp. 22R3R2A-7]|uniref:hypothetical protein n=1 Tax=Sphingomonas sp. 22R3R2A-7 TaxID=3050230 RepID=UPI002FE2F5F0
MTLRWATPVALLLLLGSCVLLKPPFPSKRAVQQLEAAKKVDALSAEYAALGNLPVECPAEPATDRQRDMVCAQLWAFKASGCVKAYQTGIQVPVGRSAISPEERAAPVALLGCALTASASAITFLPPQPNGDAALRVLILRARIIELRRGLRDTREALADDAEIGAVAARMTPLPNASGPDGSSPDGSYYASYFLAGTAARNATKAALAARAGPQDRRAAEKSAACSLARGGLQVLPVTESVHALDAPLATRRNILTRLTTEFCS